MKTQPQAIAVAPVSYPLVIGAVLLALFLVQQYFLQLVTVTAGGHEWRSYPERSIGFEERRLPNY